MKISRFQTSFLTQILCGILGVCILYNAAGHFVVLMSFKKMVRTEMKSLLKTM